MKRIIALALGLLLIVSFTACGPKKKEIAVLIYDVNDPFIALVTESIIRHSHPDANVTLYDCQNSQIIQNEIAQQLFEDKVDLLIINPVERLSSYIFVRRGEQEGVPVVFFNREPLKEDIFGGEDIYYVGADAAESGLMQANIIEDYFSKDPLTLGGKDKNQDGKLQAVILKGELGHQDAEERSTAVIEALEAKDYDVDVLMTKVADWNEEVAYNSMEEIMDLWGADIELLISNNDAMAIGASRYLYDQGFYQISANTVIDIPFPIVGIDGLSVAIDAIEDGYLYGTVINDGVRMGEAISELSSYILGLQGKMTDFDLIDERYIWISYKEHSRN